MASTFYTKKSTCGCDSSGEGVTTPSCYVLDLGEVYSNLPDYLDGPCSPCPKGEDGTTSPPHGSRGVLIGACSKLVIYKNSRVKNGEFLYEGSPLVLFSRSRQRLPSLFCNPLANNSLQVSNPLQCPAENGLRIECCKTCEITINDPPETIYREVCTRYGGPYTNVEQEEVPATGDCVGCQRIRSTRTDEWRSQEFGFGFSPCVLENPITCSGTYKGGYDCEEQEGEQYVLAGYAVDEGPTWLTNEAEEPFQTIKQEIIDSDPLGAFPHTIYVHYQLQSWYIRCCGFRPVGTSKPWVGIPDKEEREKAVLVTAAIGFSCQLCGIDPAKACEDLYNN